MGYFHGGNTGGLMTASPTVSYMVGGRIDAFVRGRDNALWHHFWAPDGSTPGWQRLDGVLYTAPTAVSRKRGVLDVFAFGRTGSLWQKSFSSGRWSGWSDRGGILKGPTLDDTSRRSSVRFHPVAISRHSKHVGIFAVGSDMAVWYISWDDERWGNWHSLGGQGTSAPATASLAPNDCTVYVRGTDTHVYHKTWKAANGWRVSGQNKTIPDFCPVPQLLQLTE